MELEKLNMATQYVHDATGTYIPATQRPDGTWRKARRVKDGYIPQDEMPLYESKGKQWAKNKPTLPVGLDPCYLMSSEQSKGNSARTIPGLSNCEPAPAKPSSKKKKKKKSDAAKVTDGVEKLDISDNACQQVKNKHSSEKSTEKAAITSSTDITKRLRNLRKKLKEINALQQKIESGEIANPEKDQLEKVARKAEIEAEIEELELEVE